VTVAVLSALSAEGSVPASTVSEAMVRYGIDPDRGDPWSD
jgi:pyruvate dehydrogenase E1 component